MLPLIPFSVEINANLSGMEWQVAVRWRLFGNVEFYHRTWAYNICHLILENRQLQETNLPLTPLLNWRFYRYAPWAPVVIPLSWGRWRQLSATISLGTGDASRTARALSLLWALVGAGLHLLYRSGRSLEKPACINIYPSFHRPQLQISVRCIVTSGIRDIMAVFLWQGLAHVLVRWRPQNWRKEQRNGESSYQGANGNSDAKH